MKTMKTLMKSLLCLAALVALPLRVGDSNRGVTHREAASESPRQRLPERPKAVVPGTGRELLPLGLALWSTHDPLTQLAAIPGITCERRVVFFGNFQVIVATKGQILRV